MIPFDKIYFIIYDPGAYGSFVQSLLNCSKKYSDKDINFNFSDGTAHANTNDCFHTFKGMDMTWNLTNHPDKRDIAEQQWFTNALSSQDKLISALETKWRNYNYEYYSQRIHTLGLYKLIELLPQSKFIYCRLNPVKTISNLDAKINNNARDIGQNVNDRMRWKFSSPKYNWWTLYTYVKSHKDMEEFIKSKKPNNLLILDVDNLIYDDNTKELDKLINFTNITDASIDKLKNIIYQYRQVNNNLIRFPIWNKFLDAYTQLNI